MFYTFSELGARKTESRGQRRPRGGGGDHRERVSPVAEGQDRALQEKGGVLEAMRGAGMTAPGGQGIWGLGGTRAPFLLSGQLWRQADLDSVLFYWFT